MAFTLLIRPKAQKSLDRLSVKERPRVLEILDSLVADPFVWKKLHGKHSGERSAKVWPYRIVYAIEKSQLLVIVITFGHRGGVYRRH